MEDQAKNNKADIEKHLALIKEQKQQLVEKQTSNDELTSELAKLRIEKDTLSSSKTESTQKVEQLLRELADFRLESEKIATALKAESAAKANEVVTTTSKLKTLE